MLSVKFYKKKGSALLSAEPFKRIKKIKKIIYTQPVGLGRPAILQAPLPGPDGKSS